MQYRREPPPKRSSEKLIVNVKYGHDRWRPKKVRRVYKDDGGSSLPDTSGKISFSDDDLNHIQLPYEEPLPLVMALKVGNFAVQRVLISSGRKASVMYWDTFNKMELDLEIIKPNKTPLVGNGIDSKVVNAIGSVYLPVSAAGRTLTVEFVLIDMRDDMESPYNLIMGCEWIGKMNGVVSTFHFMMKCPAGDGNGVVDIKGDQLMAEKCVAMEREMSLKPPQLSGNCYSETGRWKKLNSEELGIDTSMITKPTNVVLNQLKEKGYEVYLVGGCVRDLILKRTPRDFDIITSATLEQVRGIFHQCEIVGKQFPICLVHVDNTFVEVSSFKTSAPKASGLVEDDVRRPPGCNDSDYNRWRNCLERDFTMNGLMFDTCKKIVYDYLGGLEDIRKAKVRTIISAKLSFEDCARILRLVRLAARLGFQITSEIALSLKELSCSVLRLYRRRILHEMNFMLAFGSGEASMRLLWRFGLLKILLPTQASYFVSEGFQESNMLLKLFTNLDRYLEPDRPCHKSLWISIFAFHKAVVDQPLDPLVVAAFCLAVHSGGSLLESIEKAKRISQLHDLCMSFHELPKSQKLDNVALMYQVINLATSIIAVLHKMTHEYSVPQTMSQSPQAVNLFFVPPEISEDICKIFECVRYGMERGCVPKLEKEINYELLALGNLQETRHLFGRIVLNTVYPETIVDRE